MERVLAHWPVAAYGVMSVVAFAAYGIDKRRAAMGRSRLRERTLHLLDLFFGFPGGFIGQNAFRHKRRKTSFMVVFWLTVAAHLLAWLWWFGALGWLQQ